MPKYTIEACGKIVKFKARNDTEAKLRAFRINAAYTNLKRLESRWWLLVFPLVFFIFWIGV